MRLNQHTLDGSAEYVSWQGDSALLSQIVEKAFVLEIPWACWLQDNKLYATFGGQVAPYSLDQSCQNISISSNNLESSNGRQWVLPWLIVVRRFDESGKGAYDEDDPWLGWGEFGSVWAPSFCLCYDQEKTEGVVAWKGAHKDHALYDLLFAQDCQKLSNHLRINQPHNPHCFTDQMVLEEQENWSSWQARVNLVREQCHSGELSKVVLARSWTKIAPKGTEWSSVKLWQKLVKIAQANEVAFALSLAPKTSFVGLSPERLFDIDHQLITTHALAGTRSLNGTESTAIVDHIIDEFVHSPKDIDEHQIVVAQLLEHLNQICTSVNVDQLTVKRLRSLLHLETPMRGQLKPSLDLYTLLETLHPTPALGGFPNNRALAILRAHEPLSRGGYAAPWMWTDLKGHASATVGIRSVLIHHNQAIIYAGAGVVAQSVAEDEWAETQAKAEVMGALLSTDVLQSQHTIKQEPSLPLAQSALQRCLYMVSSLAQYGLSGAVLSPGSRNTPIALALHKLVPTHICVDERSAAFIALGWAKSSQTVIALCCTSGSAGSHYLPALIEAKYSAVPLMVITADRPPQLRHCGAPQTIEQYKLFGQYVKDSVELLVEDPLASTHKQQLLKELWCTQALSCLSKASEEPSGAVHINVPFEEPLWDLECEHILTEYSSTTDYVRLKTNDQNLGPLWDKASKLKSILTQALNQPKGLIYCGPLNPRAAERLSPLLLQVSEKCGWPIFAEASSQLRHYPHSLSYFDAYARLNATVNTSGRMPHPQECQVVLMVGGTTHSRAIRTWFQHITRADWFWIGEGPECVDPEHKGIRAIGDTFTSGINRLQSAIDRTSSDRNSDWMKRWLELDQSLSTYGQVKRECLWGGVIGSVITRVLESAVEEGDSSLSGDQTDLVIASSMAFRDHDMTWRPRSRSTGQQLARSWVNRGANGIDGTVSTGLGIALGTKSTQPLIVWLGDLAGFHDIQGLHSLAQWSLQHHQRPIVVLLVNNNGGGIFKHLPIRESTSFDSLFQTALKPLQADQVIQTEAWQSIAHWVQAEMYAWVQSVTQLYEAVEQAISKPLLSIIEISIDAEVDYREHLDYWASFQPLFESNDGGK